ncbi:MAG TPA: 4'-phosphopantetheinyl transferase superfamily protein [Acidothermaceae bacterium]
MSDVVTVAVTSSDGMAADELDALIQRLPEHEQRRATAMRLDSRRRNFVLGRTLLRAAVARVAGGRPDAVVVEIEPSGRPVLARPLDSFSVSIAHSGGYVVVGVANRPIGVDVEQLRHSVRFPRVAARVCSPDELRALDAMTDAARERAFLTVWSRKEAYGKAIGRGLSFPMRSVTVGPHGSRILGGEGDWQVRDLELDPAYAAAVVAQRDGWQPHLDRVERRLL